MRLHSGAAGDHDRGTAVGPGFIAQEREKCRNTGIFRNVIDLFPTLASTFDSIEKLPQAAKCKGAARKGYFKTHLDPNWFLAV